jgi:hypothetical protein
MANKYYDTAIFRFMNQDFTIGVSGDWFNADEVVWALTEDVDDMREIRNRPGAVKFRMLIPEKYHEKYIDELEQVYIPSSEAILFANQQPGHAARKFKSDVTKNKLFKQSEGEIQVARQLTLL